MAGPIEGSAQARGARPANAAPGVAGQGGDVAPAGQPLRLTFVIHEPQPLCLEDGLLLSKRGTRRVHIKHCGWKAAGRQHGRQAAHFI